MAMPRPRADPESRLSEAKGRLSMCTHSGRSHHLEARFMDLQGRRVFARRAWNPESHWLVAISQGGLLPCIMTPYPCLETVNVSFYSQPEIHHLDTGETGQGLAAQTPEQDLPGKI